jgi:hypothetical protein
MKQSLTDLCCKLVEAVCVETNLSHSGLHLAIMAVLRKLGKKLHNLPPNGK